MYPAAKQKLYMAALQDIQSGRRVKSTVQPFPKIEKMTTKKYKAPRMIQARHMTFNIEYGKFIKPLEETLFKHHYLRHHFGKGNYDEQARRIQLLASKYKYYTEADHSTFDAHITVEHLKLTHTFYAACFKHNKELRALSSKTINNLCHSRYGDRYKVKGTRMSGDVDTSLGNSLINYAIIKEMLARLNIKGDAIVNGDDSIIFTDQPIPTEEAKEIFRTMNMETEILPSVTNIHKVDFCQARLVYRNDGSVTMMMNPQRMYSKFGMTYKLTNYDYYLQYLHELTTCLMYSHLNTPVGYAWQQLSREKINFSKSPLKKFKYLDNALFCVMEREQKSKISDNSFTHSMYMAYPDLDYWLHRIKNIRFRIHNLDYNIYIDHSIKTIHYHYIKSFSYNELGLAPDKKNKKNEKPSNKNDPQPRVIEKPSGDTREPHVHGTENLYEERKIIIEANSHMRTRRYEGDEDRFYWADDRE
nr:RNA-dependent RNA polymerase [Coleopteran tombus-related virus]